MKKSLVFIALLIAYSQSISQTNQAVTVYNSDIGVVREQREFELKKGLNEIRITDVPAMIDPSSVKVSINSRLLEQNYQYDLAGMEKILGKYIDHKVTLTGKDFTLQGILISAMYSYVIKTADGRLEMVPQEGEYRITVDELPEGLITRPTLVWLVESDRDKKEIAEITYITNGLNWSADYVMVLNPTDTKFDVNAWINMNNQSGGSFKNSEVKFIAGEINRVRKDRGFYKKTREQLSEELELSAGVAQEREFFEYHIYEFDRKITLLNNEEKQLGLFDAKNAGVKKKFIFKSGSYNLENADVNIVAEFVNSKENNLGIPMPAGKFRIFKNDGKSVELVGEDKIEHTPKDQTVKLNIGKAFDLKADATVLNQDQISRHESETEMEINLKNRKNEDVEIEVVSYLGEGWEMLKSSEKYEKKDGMSVIFTIKVPKNSEKKFQFRYRNKW